MIAGLWRYAFATREVWAEFQIRGEVLVSVQSDEAHLERDLLRLQVGVALSAAIVSFLIFLAIRLARKWDLTRWLTPEANPALLGGWLAYLMAWSFASQRLPIPENIEISLFVWIFLAIVTYGLLVATVLAGLHWTEGQTGRVATGVRGLLLVLAYAAGGFALLAVLAILLFKGFAMLMGL